MASYWPSPPPTRLISWQQLVLNADPDWLAGSLRPWVYEFSNGRLFYQTQPIYGGGTHGPHTFVLDVDVLDDPNALLAP